MLTRKLCLSAESELEVLYKTLNMESKVQVARRYPVNIFFNRPYFDKFVSLTCRPGVGKASALVNFLKLRRKKVILEKYSLTQGWFWGIAWGVGDRSLKMSCKLPALKKKTKNTRGEVEIKSVGIYTTSQRKSPAKS